MSTTAARKRGRPAEFVQDSEGASIKGLSAQVYSRDSKGEAVKWRYYATYSKPRVWYGFDREIAIERFRADSGQLSRIPSVLLEDQTNNPVLASWQPIQVRDVFTKQTVTRYDVPERAFFQRVKEMLTSPDGRALMAEKTGIDELTRLYSLPVQIEPLNLSKITQLVVSREYSSNNEKSRFVRAWQEFVDAVKAKTCDECSRQNLRQYQRFIDSLRTEDGGKLGAKTVKHRFSQVVSCIEYARTSLSGYDTQLLKLKSEFRLVCKGKKLSKGGNATPISAEDFEALYQVAPLKYRAILLCMLNFAMHPSEATDILKTDIDLKLLELRCKRSKTGIERVAVVWKETKEAILAYQASEVDRYEGSKFLFVNAVGEQFRRGGLTYYFRDTWKPAVKRQTGKKLAITLDSIRDGAQNAADDGGADQLNTMMLMGHALPGVADKYKVRSPKKTAKSVEAIRQHYKIAELVKG